MEQEARAKDDDSFVAVCLLASMWAAVNSKGSWIWSLPDQTLSFTAAFWLSLSDFDPVCDELFKGCLKDVVLFMYVAFMCRPGNYVHTIPSVYFKAFSRAGLPMRETIYQRWYSTVRRPRPEFWAERNARTGERIDGPSHAWMICNKRI